MHMCVCMLVCAYVHFSTDTNILSLFISGALKYGILSSTNAGMTRTMPVQITTHQP